MYKAFNLNNIVLRLSVSWVLYSSWSS